MLEQGTLTMRSFDDFSDRFGQQTLIGFIVSSVKTGDAVGYTNLYDADLSLGHCYVGGAMRTDRIGSGLGIEGVGLTINYAFQTWRFRKLYAGVTEASARYFSSTLGSLLREEGRLRQHLFFAGEYWDLVIMALYRDDWAEWMEKRRPLLDALVGEAASTQNRSRESAGREGRDG